MLDIALPSRKHLGLTLTLLLMPLAIAPPARAQCAALDDQPPPLSELGCGDYLGEIGGLYGDGSNLRPLAHDAAGRAIARSIAPIDGRIVLVSIGMSNTAQQFGAFIGSIRDDAAVRSELVAVNGAWGGHALPCWTSASGEPADSRCTPSAETGSGNGWDYLDLQLSRLGVRPDQVQVAWIKHAFQGPASFGGFRGHADAMEAALTDVIRAARVRLPNLRMVYVSSRTHAYTTMSLNPEPYAYESAFAVRRVVLRQIEGDPALAFEGAGAPAPWIAWGPYLWAQGTREDGFAWPPGAVREDDCTHPSVDGMSRVASALRSFFLSDPSAAPWFAGAEGTEPAASPGCTPSDEDAGAMDEDAGLDAGAGSRADAGLDAGELAIDGGAPAIDAGLAIDAGSRALSSGGCSSSPSNAGHWLVSAAALALAAWRRRRRV